MHAADILYTQGFGTRKQCAALVARKALRVEGAIVRREDAEFVTDNLQFEVDGALWPFHRKAYLMLHKPVGFECSHQPSHWPSIYSLLPAPLRNRPVKGGQNGVQAVGRLDQDTTGLLLLSDDGQFIHKMNAPKSHAPKVYRVTTTESVSSTQIALLLEGVVLHDRVDEHVRAAACTQSGSHQLDLTLTEGKYHQVKRMIAAVGNHVHALHRTQVGQLALPDDLAAGEWRWLSEVDLIAAQAK